jgi:hypothetical protein
MCSRVNRQLPEFVFLFPRVRIVDTHLLVLLHIFPMMERKVCCCTNATYGVRLNAAAPLWNDQTTEPLEPTSRWNRKAV